MKIRSKISILLLLLLAQQNLFITEAMGQESKKPTLEDLIPGGETYRYTENIYGLQWWGDQCVKPTIDALSLVDTRTEKERVITTLEEVNKALDKEKLGKLQHLQSVSFPWKDKELMLFTLAGKHITYNFKENRVNAVLVVPREAANNDFNAKSGKVAYTVANDLFVDNQQVTNEPEGVVCGQSVHRNEFGINKGTFWSPTGEQLAFYRMDESMVTQYPLVDVTARIGEVNYIRYPMAGMTSHLVSVGVYTPSTGKTVYLETGDPTDRYFTNISWSPDGKSIYLIELNRDQNHAKLCQFDAANGQLTAVLIDEKHDKYVEPSHPIIFLPWDDTKFIYQSQRDGFNHLYLYNTKGDLIKQLTSGSWLVKEVLGFNPSKKEIIISSTEVSPLQLNLYRVNLKNNKRSALDNGQGIHRAQLSASGRYLIDNYATPDIPRNIELVDTEKAKFQRLLTAKDPYEGLTMPIIEMGTIKANDGLTDLHYRLVKPADFDPSKKYPAIVYVYGGPHAQVVNNSWMNGVRGWDLYMANKGYIMFSVDNRGSENRGLEFENATFRKLGVEEGKDQLKGAEFLQSLPYVDDSRIGVHGWSFGGHMTTALLLKYPEVFKVGVSGGPVIDWGYYEVMYGERYMDTPETNPEGYEQTNLKNFAGNLKGHLLMIHDDHDDTCVPQHTLSFIKACVDARTYPDLFLYPGHKHNVMGRDRVHLHEKITRYFEDHL